MRVECDIKTLLESVYDEEKRKHLQEQDSSVLNGNTIYILHFASC